MSRLERFKTEVVSGGTQQPIDPAADPTPVPNAVLGILAWLALFGFLALKSPWMLVFAIGLAISIVLHEFGHFYTARRSGMKATQFFLGFGPRIWSIHRNGVEYGVRAIPLGGFVKIIGMTNVDEVDPADESRTYRQGTYPRRMWVITAGSAMHMIIAIVLIVGVYGSWGRLQETGDVTIAAIVDGSPAAGADLQAGDIVRTVNGTEIATADALRDVLGASAPGTTLSFEIERNDTLFDIDVTMVQHPDVTDRVQGFLGVAPRSAGRVQLGLGSALVEGPQDLVTAVGQAITGIAKVINPVTVAGHLTGSNTDVTTRPSTIVGATRISEDVGEFDGWAGILTMLAAVNVSVGVFNMFPLLPLDGGHAAIATYERIRSRRGKRYFADVNKLTPIAVVCVALLAFMFLTGLYLDTVQG